MNHTIEVARLRPDQVQRLFCLHCIVVPIEGELEELYSVEFPKWARIGVGGVAKGALRTMRHCAIPPLDPPGKKEAAPTMFKRVVWTDEEPARIVGMTLVEQAA